MSKKITILMMIIALVSILSISVMAKDEVSIWHVFAVELDGRPTLTQAMDAVKKVYPDVVFEESPMEDAAYKTKMRVSLATNEIPDLYMTWGGGWLKTFVDAGKVMDLTPWLEENPEVKDAFVSSVWGPVTIDGKIYGLPVNGLGPAMIYYNEEIFDRYNLEFPETYEELKEVVIVLRDNGIIPFAMANNEKWEASLYYMYLVDRIGGSEVFSNAALRTGGSFDDPAFIEAAEKLQELVRLGAFPEGVNGLKHTTSQDYMLFYSGRAAMTLQTASGWTHISQEAPHIAEHVGIANFPMVEGGKGDPDNLVGSPGGNYIHINPETDNMEVVLEFLKNLATTSAGEAISSIGRIPPHKDVEPDGEVNKWMKDRFMEAKSTQLFYDQFLDAEIASYHLDSLQSIVDLSLSPEQMAKEWEELAKEVYGEN